MKAKIKRGSGFRGTLNYVLGKGDAEQVAGTMAGSEARSLALEFGALRQLRPDIERPVWHSALSLPPGETLDSERWGAVVRDFMGGLGFDDRHAWTCWRHNDTEHDHVHIVASRIGADGSIWLGRHDVRRALKLTEELEAVHGLQATKAFTSETANPCRQPTKAEIEQAIRTHVQPARTQLQAAINHALSDRPSLLGLMDRLEAAGITVRINMASTGRISGLSYELQGIAFKGSDLGKHYSWNQLQSRIDYEQDREIQAIAERCTGRRGPDATIGSYDSQHGRDPSDSHQSNRDSAGRDGGGPASRGGVARPDDARTDRVIQDLEDHNRRRQRSQGGAHRHLERATGTGAVARIRLAEFKASHLEIQPRRLVDMVATWSEPNTADDNNRHSSAERPNHPEMGTAPSRASQPVLVPLPRLPEKERER